MTACHAEIGPMARGGGDAMVERAYSISWSSCKNQLSKISVHRSSNW